MPRRPRLEFAGALYHVLNRGNYRRDLFIMAKSGIAFERTLFEASERYEWKLHAYVIMNNHYHLALETPKGNLATGMQWLQSVFANRFNKFTQERGHVFQGRYKALLLEPGDSLLKVVNYIHLNPVRAGIVPLTRLRSYHLSSFPKFFSKKHYGSLRCGQWLNLAGAFSDNAAGMKRYQRYLKLVDEENREKRNAISHELCRGWVVGSKGFRKEILGKAEEGELADRGPIDLQSFNEDEWERLLDWGLKRLRKNEKQIRVDKKSEAWKIALAAHLKERTSVTNRWLSQRLNIGDPSNISKHMRLYSKISRKSDPFAKALIPNIQA